MHTSKRFLYSTTIRWFGQNISAVGILFESSRISGIRQMKKFTTGADQQLFACVIQSMCNVTISFSSIIRRLCKLPQNGTSACQ